MTDQQHDDTASEIGEDDGISTAGTAPPHAHDFELVDIPAAERLKILFTLALRSHDVAAGLKAHEMLAEFEATSGDGEPPELAEVRSHLEPLGLAPTGTPPAELARIAADVILQYQAGHKLQQ